jgi:hypothetical protein
MSVHAMDATRNAMLKDGAMAAKNTPSETNETHHLPAGWI